MRKLFNLVLVITILFNLSAAMANHCKDGDHDKGKKGKSKDRNAWMKDLNLSEDQKKKVAELRKKHYNKEQSKDRKKFKDMSDEKKAAMKSEWKKKHEAFSKEFKKILNKDQQKKYDKIMAERKKKMKERDGRKKK